MEDFHKLFYDEGKELLGKLEEQLLLLEDDMENMEIINSIFRILHTLKGSGAMFGFGNLSSFTHRIESLYDEIRNKKINISSDIINHTLKSGDLIKEFIESDDDENLQTKGDEILKELEKLTNIKHETENAIEEKESEVVTKTEKNSQINSNLKLYYISFKPNEDIFKDGTKPIYLIDELSDLGESIISTNFKGLPYLNDIETEKCYFSWEILLSTEVDIDEIQEVFIFVEEDSKIEIELVSEKDIFSNETYKQKVTELFTQNLQGKDGIIKLIKLYEKDIVSLPAEEAKHIEEKDVEKIAEILQEEDEIKTEKKKPTTESSTNIESVRISSKKLDELINLVSEFVTNQARLFNIASKQNDTQLSELSEDFQNLARQFRDIAFEMRLIPIDSLIVKFRRLVRDLSKQLSKKVDFIAEGTDTELDKNIISAISDPIMHIIRNCMDHGIEPTEIRTKSNKPEIGTIKLSSYQSGSLIIISIKDDGAGIDEEVLTKKAIEKKIIKSAKGLTKQDILNLIMHPGFSTSENVSDVSGRGVGMDVVKKNVESLRGDIEIKSEKGKGTEIIIKLPLSLSIIDGLLTGVNGSYYLFPLSSVKKIFSIDNKQMDSSYKNLIQVEGKQYPFISLPNEFNKANNYKGIKSMLLVDYKDHEVGIIVDEVFSEYQAVLKPLDKLLKKSDIFSGASILGDGKLAMVIDVHILINYFSN
ncbi:MAG: hypothetical protein C0595_05535 [Marinilabiliales bacterium]|nr:MAG: hypothetical protein C0595_05535 [Marinilabiliales bacterium]